MVIRITLRVWIICIKGFPSSEFITMKLNRWTCTSSVLQAINRCWKSQIGPPSKAGGQVLVCFCSPPPHALVHVPSEAHSPHKHSVGHCNRYRIIQLYSCYRSYNNNDRTWYSDLSKAVYDLIHYFGSFRLFLRTEGSDFLITCMWIEVWKTSIWESKYTTQGVHSTIHPRKARR